MADMHSGGNGDPGGPVAWLLTHAVLLVGATVGALFRAMTRPDLTWLERIATGMVAVVMAYFATPVAVPLVAAVTYHLFAMVGIELDPDVIDPVSLIGVVGLVIGMIAIPVMEGVLKLARGWRDDPRVQP